MKYLRQSTAATIVVGPFVDKADGITPKSALASPNGRLVKNGVGAAFTPASWAHDGSGHYLVGLATGDTDTVGRLRLDWSDPTTFCPVWEDFSVLSAAVYDWLFGATAPLTTKTGFVLDPTGLDLVVVETGVNARQALSPILAAAAGVLSGAGTGTIVVKGGNVATTRITATTDASGNRSSVTLALPA